MIRFTQYLLPNGRKRETSIYRPVEIEALAAEVAAAGGRFEIEVLRTGQVSMEVVTGDSDEPRSLAHEICDNGPPLLAAVDRLVITAHHNLKGSANGN